MNEPRIDSTGILRTAELRHVRLPVRVITSSLRFYSELLGLELIWMTEREAALRCGRVDIVLCACSRRASCCRLELHVEDASEREALRRRLAGRAVRSFLRAEPGPKPGSILLLDPDGHEVVIE